MLFSLDGSHRRRGYGGHGNLGARFTTMTVMVVLMIATLLSFTQAQSAQCYACIKKSISLVGTLSNNNVSSNNPPQQTAGTGVASGGSVNETATGTSPSTKTMAVCASLSTSQVQLLTDMIHGLPKLGTGSWTFEKADPKGFECLSMMMMDIGNYKGAMWSTCFDPKGMCSWSEMMQYLGAVIKMSAVYQVPNPPALVLQNSPITKK